LPEEVQLAIMNTQGSEDHSRFVAQSLQLINRPQEDAMAGKFEVYEDRAGKFRFRLKASNGQIVATGEAYETKAAAKKGCEAVARAADGATIEETAS
jgi:uncharacterized protein YegP (UPF0339 family)